jgi:hypothetical protein
MDDVRQQAWSEVKGAVRAYARDPSTGNAQRVEAAWREIRRMQAVSFWRDWQAARLKPLETCAPLRASETEAA